MTHPALHRVLIVEDTPDRQRVLISLFRNQAWMLAHTGRRALVLLTAYEFDIVSLDYNLADELTGEDVARAVAAAPRPPRVLVHSLNPRGAAAIQRVLPEAIALPVSRMVRSNARLRRLRAGVDAHGAAFDFDLRGT